MQAEETEWGDGAFPEGAVGPWGQGLSLQGSCPCPGAAHLWPFPCCLCVGASWTSLSTQARKEAGERGAFPAASATPAKARACQGQSCACPEPLAQAGQGPTGKRPPLTGRAPPAHPWGCSRAPDDPDPSGQGSAPHRHGLLPGPWSHAPRTRRHPAAAATTGQSSRRRWPGG